MKKLLKIFASFKFYILKYIKKIYIFHWKIFKKKKYYDILEDEDEKI